MTVILGTPDPALPGTQSTRVRTGTARPGAARPGAVRAGAVRAGAVRAGAVRAGAVRAGSRAALLGRPAAAAPVRCRWCASSGADEVEFGWYSAVLPHVLADLDPRVVAAYGVEDVTADDLAFAATCRGTGDRPVLELIARALAQAPEEVAGLPVVDVGAGTAGPAAWLQARTGRRVVAIEPSAASVRTAQALFAAREGLGISRGDAAELPLPDGSAGAVTMLGLLSLVDDAGRVLREARRVAAPGANLVLTDYAAPDDRSRRGADLPEGTDPEVGDQLLRSLASAGWGVEHVMTGAALPDRTWRACRDAVDAAIARHVSLAEHGSQDACPVAHEEEQQARTTFAAAVESGRIRRTTVVARAN